MSRALGPASPASFPRRATGEFLFHRRRLKRVLIRDGWGVWAISIREQNQDARFENASEDGRASQKYQPARGGTLPKVMHINTRGVGDGKMGEALKTTSCFASLRRLLTATSENRASRGRFLIRGLRA